METYQPSPHQTLICHHSVGYEDHSRLMSLPDRKILAYHNITPPHFFHHNPDLQQVCELGRLQLQDARRFVIGSYADSNYNASELAWYGYTAPKVLPLLIGIPTPLLIEAPQNHDVFTILFVGRIVSNKCQHQLVDTLFWLSSQAAPLPLRLLLVGGVSDQAYYEFLQRHVSALGLNDVVTITNKVSDEVLIHYYQQADMFLSLSEHEGFGIPLVESVMRGLPVLAYDTGGVRTSLGDVGLLTGKAPDQVGQRILELVRDPDARQTLRLQQQKHLVTLQHDRLASQFVHALQGWGVLPPLQQYYILKNI